VLPAREWIRGLRRLRPARCASDEAVDVEAQEQELKTGCGIEPGIPEDGGVEGDRCDSERIVPQGAPGHEPDIGEKEGGGDRLQLPAQALIITERLRDGSLGIGFRRMGDDISAPEGFGKMLDPASGWKGGAGPLDRSVAWANR
jgi:hypothetical protein